MRPILASMLSLAALAAGACAADAAPQPVTYSVPQPSPPASSRLSQGWGLFATISGRSMDLGERDFRWSEDPRVQRHDVEAGYGWRKGAATAVIGYEEHDFGPKYDAASVRNGLDQDAHRIRGSGVLGLSLVLHAP